jgi:hypothetical protein
LRIRWRRNGASACSRFCKIWETDESKRQWTTLPKEPEPIAVLTWLRCDFKPGVPITPNHVDVPFFDLDYPIVLSFALARLDHFAADLSPA